MLADNIDTSFPEADRGEFANRLLNRAPQPEYLAMWSELLQRPKAPLLASSSRSLLLFRLGNDWLGFATAIVEEILESRPIHTVPNSRSKIFLGVVNVRGQLRLCVALHRLLEMNSFWDTNTLGNYSASGGGRYRTYQRMMAIKRGKEMWVFPVDEVQGAVTYTPDSLHNLPITVAKSSANYLKGLWQWQEHPIAIIDEELLFASLRRMVP